jgi:hypothetical protein
MAISPSQPTNYDYSLPNPAVLELDTNAPFVPVEIEEGAAKTPEQLEPAATSQVIFSSQSNMTTPDDVMSDFDDSDWIKQSFLVPDINLTEYPSDAVNRYWTSAQHKFTDTRMGGNIGVNSRPQFTRYSDIREKGRILSRSSVSINNVNGNYGMGRYYSEAIDDNSQTIYLRFGQPQFSSLMTYFSKAFDPKLSSLARAGRGVSAWYTIGQAVGTVLAVAAFPVLSCTLIAGRLLSMFFTRKTSKFYTLKPTMHLYWSTVNMLVNMIAINKGIMPRVFDDTFVGQMTGGGNSADQTIGSPVKFDGEMLKKLHEFMPDMFTDGYGIDVFAVANRAQRVANQLYSKDYGDLDRATETDFTGYVRKANQQKIEHPRGEHSLANWLNEVGKLKQYFVKDDPTSNDIEMDPKSQPGSEGWASAFAGFFDAEFRQGSQFAVFKVDYTGAQQEAFANTTMESDLSQRYNRISSQNREARFSLADGNITGTAVEDLVKNTLNAATDVAKGVLSGVTMGLSDVVMGAIKGLTGTGFIDIPKHWQDSSAQLPRGSYTIQLVSPYGNPISQLQNIYIPLAMILAGTLPLSTGSQSYTSPFICQLFDRGRCQIQLGMIESVNITRGTTNLAFNNRGQAMAIDVTFTVVDLSSIMHMPLSTGSLFEGNAALDEDNILMDYLAVLAGQDLYSQIYQIPKAKLNFAKRIRGLSKLSSPAYWASWTHEQTTTGMLGLIGNSFEAVVAGSSVASGPQR